MYQPTQQHLNKNKANNRHYTEHAVPRNNTSSYFTPRHISEEQPSTKWHGGMLTYQTPDEQQQQLQQHQQQEK